MVNAALKHTATMAVRTDRDAILADSVEDELSIFSLEMVEAFLDDMIAVKVLDESDNIATQCIDDNLDL